MLGANQMTTTTGAVFIPQLWSKKIITAFEARLIFGDKVWRFDDEVKEKGSSIKIPNVSNLVANDKVANTQVVLQAPTEGSITLTIDKHKHVAFLIEDILAAQSSYNLMSEYTKKAGYALRKAVDTDLANLATGFSQSAGTYNTTVSTSAILLATKTLDDNDVDDEDRCWIFKPKAISDLRTISDYTRYDGTGYAGNAAKGGIGNGEVRPNGLKGMLYNADVYQSTQVAQSGNNISNVYMHREALALGIQKNVRVQTANRIDYLGELLVADTIYGVIETRDLAGVEFRS